MLATRGRLAGLALVVLLVSGGCGPLRPAGDVDGFPGLDGCLAATVKVTAYDKEGAVLSAGSGVVVGETAEGSVILTASHVVLEGAARVGVVQDVRDLKSNFDRVPRPLIRHEASAVVKARGDSQWENDWAVLHTDKRIGSSIGPIPIFFAFEHAYERVVAVGYSFGLSHPTVTVGHLQPHEGGLLRISAPTIFGSSGGGAYAAYRGKLALVGITVRVFTVNWAPVTHMGLCVDVRRVIAQGGF